ncbi:MAG TPA: DnaA/Hda family protein [Hyphomicrobiaceae bacterium]|nr:DnaA/Hda family protein [Hyphomicrobiaceae bacterium]
MTARPEQLVFDLPHRPAEGAEDFLVSASNAAAVAAIDAWPAWLHRALAVVGPPGSGKSHLVSVWRRRAGGLCLAASELTESAAARASAEQAIAIEDIDRGIGDERVLFHLLNLASETRLHLLLTTRSAPGEMEIALSDLRSRLRALALVRIEAPDEALLKALLVKLFADRQLAVEPHVVAYLALHMERSADAARRIVAEMDRLALKMHRRLTRALAAEALNRLGMWAAED